MLGVGGSKLFDKRKEKSYVKQIDDLANNMRGFQKEPGNLKEYSPWLSNFRAETLKAELEIPGELCELPGVMSLGPKRTNVLTDGVFSLHLGYFRTV